ncbi:MAG: LysM peptidoglycan-binding domain-containing protein [Endomicrobia bacterium]|nr:LysM peptidoglycan-binding domain-containing protein [Endomicrobiia bacterium]
MKKILVFIIALVTHIYSSMLYNYSFSGYPQESFAVFSNPTIFGWFGVYSINSGYGLLLNNVLKDKIDAKWLVAGGSYKKIFAGVGYQNLLLQNIYSEEVFILNFGSKILSENIFLGSNMKMYTYKYFYDEYYKDDPIAENTVSIYNIDIGISKRFNIGIYSGLNILNFLSSKAGKIVEYTVPKKYSFFFGYNYSTTVLNIELFFQDVEVGRIVHSYSGYKIGLNQELYSSKLVSFDVTVGVSGGYKNTIFDFSLQTKLFSNRLSLKYTIVYTVADISGFVGNHYIMLNYLPKEVPKRRIVKQVQEVEEIVVVEPKKKKVVTKKEEYEIEPSTTEVREPSEEVSPKELEILPKMIPEQQKIVEEKVRIIEKKEIITEYKFPLAHKVKEGETLISISEKYYNNKKKWKKIYEVNKDKIIKGVPIVGEVLIIPEP